MNYQLGDIFTRGSEANYRTGMIGGISTMQSARTGDGFMKLETFGQRLNWARRNIAKLTQQELRDRMEKEYNVPIGRNYISELELEKTDKRPSFEVVCAMAGVMKVSMDFLAGFTEVHTPAQGEETPPHFFSEEADEVAQLIDDMRPDQRTLIAGLIKNISALPTERQRRQEEMREMLNLIESNLGKDARNDIERIARNRGLFIDS